jgi:hypothetical protein
MVEDKEPTRSQNQDVLLPGPNEYDEEDIDIGPFLSYLETEKGHEIASKVLSIFEDIKRQL